MEGCRSTETVSNILASKLELAVFPQKLYFPSYDITKYEKQMINQILQAILQSDIFALYI